MKKTFTTLLALSSLFFVLGTSLVYANPFNPAPSDQSNPSATDISNPIKYTIDNPFKSSVGDSLYGLIQNIMNDIVLPIGGVLCVLAFIYAGFMYVTAQGDETKIKNAHNTLLYAAIGTAVLLGSWVLATAICKTIGALGGPVCTF